VAGFGFNSVWFMTTLVVASGRVAGLTPKGPLVPMGDKPILACVVRSHTIFRFFETFREDASQNKLRVSANFMILGAMVQKLWKFEVFR
jgi:hypothetical protein